MRRFLMILTCCLISTMVVRVHAVDETLPRYQGLEALTPLDARVEDVSILSASLRVESAGLAMPSGFDDVYRVPGDSGKLMRVNGALFAVFDQSVYQSYQGRSYPDVPPSTVFHIGPPFPDLSKGSFVQVPEVEATVVSSTNRAGFGYVAPATNDSSTVTSTAWPRGHSLPRFVADDEYRARRLAELVERRLSPSRTAGPRPDQAP